MRGAARKGGPYREKRPPVFWVAAALIVVLLLVLAALLVPRLISWAYALPLHLFEGVGAARALGTSEERARGHRLSLAAALTGWFALSIVMSTVALGVVGTLGRFLVPRFQGSMPPLLFVMGGLSLLWAVVNLIVTLIQASTFALLVVRLYERHGGAVGAKFPQNMPETLATGVDLNLTFKKLLTGLTVASAVAALAGYFLIAGVRMDDDVLVIAHRSAAGRSPENTLASVEAAIEDEADLVEIDVQETRDGRVVVIHDSDFKKIAGSGLKIWEGDFDEVRELDIGSWFAPEFHAERLPTLEEVLEVAKGRARVDIELKYYGHDERLEERVVQIVEEMGMASDVVLMSLKLDAIRKLRVLRPSWTIGLLSATAVGDLTRVDADFLAVNTGLVTPRFVRRAHAAGKDVHVWTVNDPVNMFWMISRGVDGLITDEPALARTVLTRRADMTAIERLLLEAAFWLGVVPKEPPPESDV